MCARKDSAVSRRASGLELDAAAPTTPRGRRTRAALIEAGARIFERDGFLSARIADIAAEAQVAIGTFYSYFASKEQLFFEVVDSLIEDLYQQSHVADLVGADPVERIRATNARFVHAFAQHARLYSVLQQVASFNPELQRRRQRSRQAFVARAARGIRSLQREGQVDRALDADLVAALLCGMVEDFVEVRYLLGQPLDDEDAIEVMTLIWARALALEPTGPEHPTPELPSR